MILDEWIVEHGICLGIGPVTAMATVIAAMAIFTFAVLGPAALTTLTWDGSPG